MTKTSEFEAPDYLTDEQRAEWTKLATGARTAGVVLEPADGPLLEQLVVAISEFRRFAAIAEAPDARPWDRKSRDDAGKRMVAISDRLGLNPRSRARIGVKR